MFNSDILDVALGLFLIFFVFATVCSAITEGIQWATRQRAAFLLEGIRVLVGGQPGHGDPAPPPLPPPGAAAPPVAPAVGRTVADLVVQSAASTAALHADESVSGRDFMAAVLGHPLIAALGRDGSGDPLQAKNAPSYISSRLFGRAVVDVLTRGGTGETDLDKAAAALAKLPADLPARGALQSFITNAQGNVDRFRMQVEQWYDDHMDRVSGWFNRWARVRVIVLAVIVALVVNINPIAISRSLYTDTGTRALVAAKAADATNCAAPAGSTTATSISPADCVKEQVEAVQGADLPLFWRSSAACSVPSASCSWWEAHGLSGWNIFLTVFGLILGMLGLAMGAPFWFDLLGKVSSLRPSGPKPVSGNATTTLASLPTGSGDTSSPG